MTNDRASKVYLNHTSHMTIFQGHNNHFNLTLSELNKCTILLEAGK